MDPEPQRGPIKSSEEKKDWREDKESQQGVRGCPKGQREGKDPEGKHRDPHTCMAFLDHKYLDLVFTIFPLMDEETEAPRWKVTSLRSMKRRRKAAIGIYEQELPGNAQNPPPWHRPQGTGPLVRSPTFSSLAKTCSLITTGCLSLPWLCQAIIIYEEHSFIHHLPTQGKIYDIVGMDLS